MTRHLCRTALLTALSALAGPALTAAPATATTAAGPHASALQALPNQAPSLRELPEPPDAVKARELLTASPHLDAPSDTHTPNNVTTPRAPLAGQSVNATDPVTG
ncbi:hypothetical protein [Streptomyces sp. NPDC018352]|uniref:hypothetical protein n=1 Tax=Streptomyces sp. NPDC018352 TaxID=3157194 RepID=UPI0033EB0FC5